MRVEASVIERFQYTKTTSGSLILMLRCAENLLEFIEMFSFEMNFALFACQCNWQILSFEGENGLF